MANPEGFNQYKNGPGSGGDRAARVDKMLKGVKARNQRVAQIAKAVGAKTPAQLTGIPRDKQERMARQGHFPAPGEQRIGGGRAPIHSDHGARQAEVARQAAHDYHGVAAKAAAASTRANAGNDARAHREAAGAHSNAAAIARLAGDHTSADAHHDVARSHAQVADMAVHHPPSRGNSTQDWIDRTSPRSSTRR